jgi:hypothetical protein
MSDQALVEIRPEDEAAAVELQSKWRGLIEHRAIPHIAAALAAHRLMAVEETRANPALQCDFCGMYRSSAQERGLPKCMPPYTVRLHSFTGAHPADRRRAKEAAARK